MKKLTTEEFIEKAKKVHGNKYDYSKVEYKGNHTKVCIICPEHGEFWQTPNGHLNGSGCPICSYKVTPRHKRKTKEQFIEEANKKHNYKYDYSEVEYINNKIPVCIICHNKDKYGREHGKFYQRPDNHLHGQVCPKCAKKESRLERNIKDFLIKNNINFVQEKKFNWLNNLRLDFYLPDYNMAIECQGEQHFIPIDFSGQGKEQAYNNLCECQKKDILKQKLCKENNVNLIYYTSKEINKKFNKNYITDIRKIKLILNNKKYD